MLILAAVGHCFKHANLKTHFRDPLRRQDVAFVDSPTTSKMSNLDVEDFIQQNRAVADQVDTFRGYWESEKHWQPRREFILRNINDFQPQQLDHLLSLSMVWANNVFLGCRYENKPLSLTPSLFSPIYEMRAWLRLFFVL